MRVYYFSLSKIINHTLSIALCKLQKKEIEKKTFINFFVIFSCIKNSLANAVGALYVRRYFKEESRQNAMEMVLDIKDAFNDILTEIEWMDKTTK